jgi:OTU domain-containing protein 6
VKLQCELGALFVVSDFSSLAMAHNPEDVVEVPDVSGISKVSETEVELLSRHKKESKDLIARITGMKKQATKKNRKDIQKQSESLQEDMKRRHEEELKQIRREPAIEVEEESEDEFSPEKLLAELELEEKTVEKLSNAPSATNTATNGPKRNRRKEKLAKRQEDIKKMQEEASLEAAEQPDLRKIEHENMARLCELQGLVQYDITPDGHCLFASISDQLILRKNISATIQELRTQAAQYIRSDPTTFGPFLFDENSLTVREIGPYCDEIENTAMWGGDMEILALAKVYGCCISVLFSGRSTLRVNEGDIGNGELKLAYYKHSYGLGEHYNSLRDIK